MARPRIVIDWDLFKRLCRIQCTQAEIADVLGCSVDTLERAVKREKSSSFAELYKKEAAQGKMSLRRAQYRVAIGGDGRQPNTAMLIWLGKQYLGQKDIPTADAAQLPKGFDLEEI